MTGKSFFSKGLLFSVAFFVCLTAKPVFAQEVSTTITEEELVGTWKSVNSIETPDIKVETARVLTFEDASNVTLSFQILVTDNFDEDVKKALPGTCNFTGDSFSALFEDDDEKREYEFYRDDDDIYIVEKGEKKAFYRVDDTEDIAQSRGAYFKNIRLADSLICVNALEEGFLQDNEINDQILSFNTSYLQHGANIMYLFGKDYRLSTIFITSETSTDESLNSVDGCYEYYKEILEQFDKDYNITWKDEDVKIDEGYESSVKNLSNEEALKKGHVELSKLGTDDYGITISVTVSNNASHQHPVVNAMMFRLEDYTEEELAQIKAGKMGRNFEAAEDEDEDLMQQSDLQDNEAQTENAEVSADEDEIELPVRTIYGTQYLSMYALAPELPFRTYMEGVFMGDTNSISCYYGCSELEDAIKLYEIYIDYLNGIFSVSQPFTMDDNSTGYTFLEAEDSVEPSIAVFYTNDPLDPYGSEDPDHQSYLVCIQIYKDPENPVLTVKKPASGTKETRTPAAQETEDETPAAQETEKETQVPETESEKPVSKTPTAATQGERNAAEKAESYLQYSAFSYEGLIDQLEFEGYSHSEAVYGADSTGANWKEQALKKAKQYLDYSAFSYEGLIDQLEYEKYTHEEAVYGVDNCGADWKEQAAKKAKSYLDYSSFSRDGLIDQLEFEGFTHDEAVYGASRNGY